MASKKPRVLISDKMSPKAAEVFRTHGLDVDEKFDLSPDDLLDIIKDYDGLAVRSSTKVTRELMEAAPQLKVIGRAGIGIDNIDLEAATSLGIVVMNTPFGNSITTAEHTVAMMLALSREIPQADVSTQDGRWEKSRFMGMELTSKTLGLIGCGNIGSIVADRAHGLKMKVIAYDPFLTEERAINLRVEKVTLPELLKRADFITLHTPLTDSTRNIIDRDAIAATKKGVCIVNCARGGLIDETALKEALESGHVRGAALDVFSEEPAKSNILFGTPGLICTPHLGASTTEAQVNVALQVADQMSEYLTSGGVTNALNMPSLAAEDAPILRPYMELARLLGSLVGQLTSSLRSITVSYEGDIAELNTKPVTTAILAGVMQTHSDTINMVNAPSVIKDHGIDVSEIKHDRPGDYHTLIRLATYDGTTERSVAGTLFSNDEPRLVEIFGIKVEANLAGHMLFVVNNDTPGFIGRLGTCLGSAGVNIGTFHLGRRAAGGEAILLLSVDQPISAHLLGNMCNLPDTKMIKALKF